MAQKQARRNGPQHEGLVAHQEVSEYLPEGAARRHKEAFCEAVDLMASAMHDYIFDYPSVARHRRKLEALLGDVQTHLYPHVDRPKLVINLTDAASIEIEVPRSEGGALQTGTFLEKARDRMLAGKVPVSEWADYCREGSATYNLALLAHHLDRRENKDDVFLVDRLALLSIVSKTEEDADALDLNQMIDVAERRLGQQRKPWSRRELSFLRIGRSNRLLHMDRQNSPRDDQIEMQAELPSAVQTSLQNIKNAPLQAIVEIPGLETCNLKATKVRSVADGSKHIVHTDAWSKRKLHVLRLTSSRKPR